MKSIRIRNIKTVIEILINEIKYPIDKQFMHIKLLKLNISLLTKLCIFNY